MRSRYRAAYAEGRPKFLRSPQGPGAARLTVRLTAGHRPVVDRRDREPQRPGKKIFSSRAADSSESEAWIRFSRTIVP